MKKGTKHKPETRAQMSEAHSGEKHHNYGKTTSDEIKKKIGDGNRGKIIPVKVRKKISNATTGENNAMYGK